MNEVTKTNEELLQEVDDIISGMEAGGSIRINAKNLKHGVFVNIDKITAKSVHYKIGGVLRKENKAIFASRVISKPVTKAENHIIKTIFNTGE